MQKVAVVTGGTKGIGRALVDKFLANDYKVIKAHNYLRISSDTKLFKHFQN